jgi:hypothetical protein
MAPRAELRITVTSSRNASTIRIRSVGSYRGLTTNQENVGLVDQPLFGTASEEAFWTSVLAVVAPNV